MKFKTSTGTIETIQHTRTMFRFQNPNHEIGISIPPNEITAFFRRWVYKSKNESMEINIKNNQLVISIKTNFKHPGTFTTSMTRHEWDRLEKYARGNLK